MVNKKLADWIKSEEAQGYTEQQLKNYLIKKKYNKKDIEDAISLAKSHRTFNFKDFIKPTPLKLFFPILFLVLILVSFFINSSFLPETGEQYCQQIKSGQEMDVLKEQIKGTSSIHNIDPKEVVNLLEKQELLDKKKIQSSQEFRNQLLPVMMGNIYFYPSLIYKLNPFFPVPCEFILVSEEVKEFTSFRCSYYISQEDYQCLKDQAEKEQNDQWTSMATYFQNAPEYKQIHNLDLLFNSILLIIIIYLIICGISLLFDYSKQKSKKTKLLLSLLLLISPFFLYLIGLDYALFYYPFVILFSILLFVKEKPKKIILYISIFLLIVLLIGMLFLFSSNIMKGTIGGFSSQEDSFSYKIAFCEDTWVLPMESKISYRITEKYINEEWNVCSKPCSILCKDYCESEKPSRREFSMLRGDKPSCICGC